MATTDPQRATYGVRSPVGRLPWYNRREIYDFVKEANYMQFSLYVQALRQMMNEPETNPLSYHALASIHGAPYVPWKGSGGEGASDSLFKGYCTHNTTLFPTWHRPYVALFEQTLQSHAITIANQYTDGYRDKWIDAAASLRQPYWDWVLKPLPPPEIYDMDKVKIYTPYSKSAVFVDNPFLYYRFSTTNENSKKDFPAEYLAWKRTARFVKLDEKTGKALLTDGEPIEDRNALKSFNQSTPLTRQINVFKMLTECHTWEQFVDPGDANCLEGIHNNIHRNFGGNDERRGQFTTNFAAAFDPVFWLHHAQTDRLFALWSAINPRVWVAKMKVAHGGSYTFPANSELDEHTELTPFYCAQSDDAPLEYWRSSELRGALSFQPLLGYSYPDFDNINSINEKTNDINLDEIRNTTLTRATKLYNPLPQLVLQTQGMAPEAATATIQTVLLWTAQVRVKQYALGLTSVTVCVFVGPVPDDPNDWDTAPSFAGNYSTMVNATMLRCANCVQQAEAGLVVGGAVYLNSSIGKYGREGGPGEASDAVNSLEPEDVVPLLEKQLQWRVHTGSRSPVHPSAVDGLEVKIVATPIVWPTDAVAPTYGEPLTYLHITRGRPGGA